MGDEDQPAAPKPYEVENEDMSEGADPYALQAAAIEIDEGADQN